MAWQQPKINWTASDGVFNTDLNRIESNTADLNSRALAEGRNYVRHPGFARTSGSGSNYTVTLSPAPTSVPEGFTLTIVPHTNSTAGAVTLTVNGMTAYRIARSNGDTILPAGLLKSGIPVTLVRVGSYFFISSGGGYQPGDYIYYADLSKLSQYGAGWHVYPKNIFVGSYHAYYATCVRRGPYLWVMSLNGVCWRIPVASGSMAAEQLSNVPMGAQSLYAMPNTEDTVVLTKYPYVAGMRMDSNATKDTALTRLWTVNMKNNAQISVAPPNATESFKKYVAFHDAGDYGIINADTGAKIWNRTNSGANPVYDRKGCCLGKTFAYFGYETKIECRGTTGSGPGSSQLQWTADIYNPSTGENIVKMLYDYAHDIVLVFTTLSRDDRDSGYCYAYNGTSGAYISMISTLGSLAGGSISDNTASNVVIDAAGNIIAIDRPAVRQVAVWLYNQASATPAYRSYKVENMFGDQPDQNVFNGVCLEPDVGLGKAWFASGPYTGSNYRFEAQGLVYALSPEQ